MQLSSEKAPPKLPNDPLGIHGTGLSFCRLRSSVCDIIRPGYAYSSAVHPSPSDALLILDLALLLPSTPVLHTQGVSQHA